ncbi:MAG: hypothetical protein ACYC27_03210 [Armatimonadota bacterium]
MLFGFRKTGQSVEQTVGDDNPLPVGIDTEDRNFKVSPVAGTLSTGAVVQSVAGIEAKANAQAYAGSALVNTIVRNNFAAPAKVRNKYWAVVKNKSAITSLVVSLYNVLTIGGEITRTLMGYFSVPKAPVLVVDNCDAVWNETPVAGVTVTADATDKKEGSASVKITADSSVGIGRLASKVISKNLAPYTDIVAWLKGDINIAAGDLQLLLDEHANCVSPLETFNLPALSAGVWKKVFLRLSSQYTDTAIISIGIKQTVDLGAFNLWIDDVRVIDTQTAMVPVEGLWAAGSTVDAVVSNDTALGATDESTFDIAILEY